VLSHSFSLSLLFISEGGIPAWLQFNRPNIRFRSYNEPWLTAVSAWFSLVVAQTRGYFADRGGPIVMMQVENELNGADERYVQWNGDLAASLKTNVPVLMCNGQSANNTINSCNGNDCTNFLRSHGQNGRVLVDQPAIWTEVISSFSVSFSFYLSFSLSFLLSRFLSFSLSSSFIRSAHSLISFLFFYFLLFLSG